MAGKAMALQHTSTIQLVGQMKDGNNTKLTDGNRGAVLNHLMRDLRDVGSAMSPG